MWHAYRTRVTPVKHAAALQVVLFAIRAAKRIEDAREMRTSNLEMLVAHAKYSNRYGNRVDSILV